MNSTDNQDNTCIVCGKFYGPEITDYLCSICYKVEKQLELELETKITSSEVNQSGITRDKLFEKQQEYTNNMIQKRINDDILLRKAYTDKISIYFIDNSVFDNIVEVVNNIKKRLTHEQLFNFLREELGDKYLSWEQAKTIYLILILVIDKQISWKYEHMLCSFVADTWNIDQYVMSVGYCYYGSLNGHMFRTTLNSQKFKKCPV
jgi:hypothetical protein